MKDKWWNKLTPARYQVLREGATEPPGSGELLYNDKNGIYCCGACGQALFSSSTKYDSGSGWPSFWDAHNSDNVRFREDDSLGVKREEVVCSRCGSHLGHVFDDGPKPTGRRYCINSLSLDFKPDDENIQSES